MGFPPTDKSLEGVLRDNLERLTLVERRLAIGGGGGSGGGGSTTVITALTEAQQWDYRMDPSVWAGPVGARLSIPTHVTPAGGDATHPSVLYFPDKWNGWRYWMAYTPYPGSNDDHEDPNLAVSQDGITWQFAPGVTQPLDDADGQPEYNSDTDLAMGPDDTMYLFWRWYDSSAAGTEERVYMRSSTNGVTWTPKQLVYQWNQTAHRPLSPSFLYEDGHWTVWAVDIVDSANRRISKRVNSGRNPTTGWQTPVYGTITAVPAGKQVWHLDVRRIGGQYVMLLNSVNPGSGGLEGTLSLGTSYDGVAWVGGPVTVIPQQSPSNHDGLYRGTFVPEINDGVMSLRVWYGAFLSTTNGWGIYRTLLKSTTVGGGTPGPAGPTGPQGPAGPTGATGPAGPTGPQGATGATGAQGPQGTPGTAGATGAQGPKGDKGDPGTTGATGSTGPTGPANSLAIGTVTTGAPGSAAGATITGTPPAQTLSLAIPRGDVGAQGPQGVKGDTGSQGPKGDTGPQGATAPDATTTTKGSVKLAGDLAGTADLPTVPGLANKAPLVHTHAQADITNLVNDLGLKAPLASPALTGTPTVPTAAPGTSTTQAASTAFVGAAVTAAAVPVASETVQGKVELATAAETTTGADNTRAVHPAGLKVELDKKAPLSHTHTKSQITDFAHTHPSTEITDFATAVPAAVPAASETVQGKVELATTAEATAGTDTTRAVTAAGVKAVGDTKAPLSHTHTSTQITDFATAVPAAVPAATEALPGKVELATAAETTTGTDNTRAVHPQGLKVELDKKAGLAHTHAQADITNLVSDLALKAPLASPPLTGTPTAPTAAPGTNTTQLASTAFVTAAVTAAAVPVASETVAGKVELATNAEALAGTDITRAVHPAGVKAVADTKAPLSHTHTASQVTDFATAVPAAVPAASETVQGKVELATAAETTTGTDQTRAVHPAGLKVELDKKAGLVHTHTSAQISDATAAATPNTVIKRDGNGNAKVADPLATTDIATKGYVDLHDGALIPKSIITSDGDLIVGAGAGIPARLPVGPDGATLVADAAADFGVRWDGGSLSTVSADVFVLATQVFGDPGVRHIGWGGNQSASTYSLAISKTDAYGSDISGILTAIGDPYPNNELHIRDGIDANKYQRWRVWELLDNAPTYCRYAVELIESTFTFTVPDVVVTFTGRPTPSRMVAPPRRGPSSLRDARLHLPASDAEAVALANTQASWFNTDLGWEEMYYAPAGSAGLTTRGLAPGYPAGWYPRVGAQAWGTARKVADQSVAAGDVRVDLAADDMQGGVTFANNALVVPHGGYYDVAAYGFTSSTPGAIRSVQAFDVTTGNVLTSGVSTVDHSLSSPTRRIRLAAGASVGMQTGGAATRTIHATAEPALQVSYYGPPLAGS